VLQIAADQICKPEEDGVTDLTIYIDKETWLQVGSVLKGDNDQYIAQYFFRDIKLNPEFTRETFAKEALTK
jgi:outer membrane lipoprotein-sorting protein